SPPSLYDEAVVLIALALVVGSRTLAMRVLRKMSSLSARSATAQRLEPDVTSVARPNTQMFQHRDLDPALQKPDTWLGWRGS
ncbi:MAG: hypothetical protein M3345_00575, partial [Actinomycetota bacterium]|nr:hypothetical protein [Actinomycetota bacterium]